MKLLRITAIAIMALAALTAAADKIHVAKKGESIGGIAYQYNISVDELLRHNPHAVTGVRPGMKITVPDAKGSSYSTTVVAEDNPAPAAEVIADSVDNPVDNPADNPDISYNFNNSDFSNTFDFSDYSDSIETGATNILVMLPLASQHGRQTENYVDFYRGMVLAANNAKDADGLQVGIHTYDIPTDTIALIELANRAIDNDVAAIVVPNNDFQIDIISGIAADRGAYVANFFSVKDSTYATNPYMLQTYINQQLMYNAAIDYLLTEYTGYTPVILTSAKGKKEKEPFINALRERYDRFGLNVLEVKYDETLTMRALSSLPKGSKYVFVPMSGSREVFNNFAEAVQDYIMDHPLDAALFGYPDWTSFNGESAEMLHTLGAEIYTRFFLDKHDPRLRRLSQDYSHWYGQEMLEVMPSMAALGYDAGSFLIQWIQDSQGHIGELFDGEQMYEGLQSSFRMGHGNDNAGFVNTSLYFVRFKPDGTTKVTVR